VNEEDRMRYEQALRLRQQEIGRLSHELYKAITSMMVLVMTVDDEEDDAARREVLATVLGLDAKEE